MTIREQIDLGYDGRFSFKDLVESDLTPQEKQQAELVRLEGIRRRWLVHDDKVPHLVKRERVEEDIEFLLFMQEGLRKVIGSFAQQRDQAAFAAQRLNERVKRLEQDRGEKRIVAPSGRDMRAVLKSRER